MAIVQFVQDGSVVNREATEATFRKKLVDLNGNLSSSIGDPTQLAVDVQGLVGGVEGSGGVSALGGLKALRKVLEFGNNLKTVAVTTVSRVQQLSNQDALVNLVRQSAIVEMARLSKDLEFESFDEAVAVRDEIGDLLEVEALSTTNDDLFSSFMNLRSSVVRDITERSADLSRIEERPPVALSNSLVMAHNLYEDATREQEIVERNALPLPGFISPNQTVRVLNQ